MTVDRSHSRRARAFNPLLRAALGIACAALLLQDCGKKSADEVTIYVSEDQVFAEPVLRQFEKESGVRVNMVFDTEEAKSTGVMNRLIAEKANPQADVYWANEPIRAEVLKQKGIADVYRSPNAREIPERFKDPGGCWTGFSARLRVLLVDKRADFPPASLLAYADPRWKGKGVIANPLFGTTTANVAALFTIWGEDRARAFMEALKANGTRISTSNGESADFVASAESAFALVDSDDAVNRIRQGKSVALVYPDQEEGDIGCMVVPNCALLIKGAPHPAQARKLIDYLLSHAVERMLAAADCAQVPLHPGMESPPDLKRMGDVKTMDVDYAAVARKLTEIQPYLKSWLGY